MVWGEGREEQSKGQFLRALAPSTPGYSRRTTEGRECEPRNCTRGRRERSYLRAPDIRRAPPPPTPRLPRTPWLPGSHRLPLGALPHHSVSSPTAPSRPDPQINLPALPSPREPGILSGHRGLPGISTNARAQSGRGGGTEHPRPIRPDVKNVPAHITSSRLWEGEKKKHGWRQTRVGLCRL